LTPRQVVEIVVFDSLFILCLLLKIVILKEYFNSKTCLDFIGLLPSASLQDDRNVSYTRHGKKIDMACLLPNESKMMILNSLEWEGSNPNDGVAVVVRIMSHH